MFRILEITIKVKYLFQLSIMHYEHHFIAIPERYSFLSFGKSFRSMTGVTTPSSIPNSVSMPIVISIRKNMTAQTGAKGILLKTSVKIIVLQSGIDFHYDFHNKIFLSNDKKNEPVILTCAAQGASPYLERF